MFFKEVFSAHQVKNDRDFNGKKRWKCYSKNLLNVNGKCKIYRKKRKLTFPEFPALHFKFCCFFFEITFFLVFSYQLCLLWLYVTSNVVKLMFIAYFSLLRSSWWRSVFVWMTLCFFYICYYLKAALVHHVTLISSCFWWLSVYYKDTDFSTLIGCYINIISVNEITVFNCKFKL